jgi:hypothetical protein
MSARPRFSCTVISDSRSVLVDCTQWTFPSTRSPVSSACTRSARRSAARVACTTRPGPTRRRRSSPRPCPWTGRYRTGRPSPARSGPGRGTARPSDRTRSPWSVAGTAPARPHPAAQRPRSPFRSRTGGRPGDARLPAHAQAGHVERLPAGHPGHRRTSQPSPATHTGRRLMHDRLIRTVRLGQGAAIVARLPARTLTALAPQRFPLRRGQAISRRRPRRVRRVLPQRPLRLSDPGLKLRNPLSLPHNELQQLGDGQRIGHPDMIHAKPYKIKARGPDQLPVPLYAFTRDRDEAWP